MELLREEVFVSGPQPFHMLSGEEGKYVTFITMVLSVGSKLNEKARGGRWQSVGVSCLSWWSSDFSSIFRVTIVRKNNTY